MTCPVANPGPESHAKLELADVFREHTGRLSGLSRQQWRVARAIARCRTAALGGHVQECDHCGHREISYNSCRNRHCPKCQRLEEARWLQARQAELLPTEYHHVVLTVPHSLHPFFRVEPKLTYDLLFAAVAETLLEVGRNPKNLGATIGFTAVLHTWTQTLLYHPHIHCIVTGGGLSNDGTRWISSKHRFLFPVGILAEVFRGKFLDKLEQALAKKEIRAPQAHPEALLQEAARKRWVIYSKPPFAGPDQVLRYLGRYTHRIAISNERLVSMQDGQITFRWKDRAHGNQSKLMTLDALEFLQRFLLHVLPRGLVRVRHYGLVANGAKRKLIASCRRLLGVDQPHEPTGGDSAVAAETWQELFERLTGRDVTLCPKCQTGHLVRKEWGSAISPSSTPPAVGRSP